MGKEVQGHTNINWETLYPVRYNLNHITQPITEEEIRMIINEWPSNKTPGPEGFTGEFYKAFNQ